MAQRQHRHQHVFGDGLLVASDVANRDAAWRGGQVDQVEPRRGRLQQFEARRFGKIFLPDMADDNLGFCQGRDQALGVAEIAKHGRVEFLGGLGEDGR